MLSWFTKKLPPRYLPVDIHSHLLAGLDDGVSNQEEALVVISKFRDWGYRKLITTPHVMSDVYRNSSEQIQTAFQHLQQTLSTSGIPMEMEVAAEYYLDTWLLQQVEQQTPLLTFGKRLLLFEMNYITEPYQLNEFIFNVIIQGYQPVLAHPERYSFMTMAKAEDLRTRGVLFQLNAMSFTDYYSPAVRKLTKQFVEQQWVELIGSDCHSPRHLPILNEAFGQSLFQKALDLPLLNYQL